MVESLVNRPDHVVVVHERASQAHEFATAQLGLPVAWPFADFGTFASGGVGVGNVNIEFIATRRANPVRKPRFIGVAFEPFESIDDRFIEQLRERTIEHSAPSVTPGWTTIDVPELSTGLHYFFCEYKTPYATTSEARMQALESVGGGALGVKRAREIVIGTRDLETSMDSWRKVLGPETPDSSMRWQFENGPDLRIVEHHEDAIVRLVVECQTIDPAASMTSLSKADGSWSELPVQFEAVHSNHYSNSP